MSISPKPLMPGVSIMYPPSIGYIVENVVVWRPLPWESDMLPVRTSAPGSSEPISVDLPTPELPATSVVRPASSARTLSTPSPVEPESRSTSYPARRYVRQKSCSSSRCPSSRSAFERSIVTGTL